MLKEQIFKANDIRGVVTGVDPELDLDGARRLGAAFVDLLGLSGKTFVTGRARSAVHRKSQPGAVQRHEILPGRRLSRALRFHR